jgi:plasmid stability protein
LADLLVQDIPDEMTQGLAARADKAGHSVSDEVKAIIERELGENSGNHEASALEMLRSIMVADSEEEAAEYIKIMDEIEAERKRDFGRPVEDLE